MFTKLMCMIYITNGWVRRSVAGLATNLLRDEDLHAIDIFTSRSQREENGSRYKITDMNFFSISK